MLPQVLQGVFSAGKLCQYWREGRVSILPVQSDAKQKDELFRLPRQGLLGASWCKQQHSVVLRKQETWSVPKTFVTWIWARRIHSVSAFQTMFLKDWESSLTILKCCCSTAWLMVVTGPNGCKGFPEQDRAHSVVAVLKLDFFFPLDLKLRSKTEVHY